MGVRKGRREGLRQKGRKKMVEQREKEGVTEDDRRRVLLGSRLCLLRNIQHVSCTLAAAI